MDKPAVKTRKTTAGTKTKTTKYKKRGRLCLCAILMLLYWTPVSARAQSQGAFLKDFSGISWEKENPFSDFFSGFSEPGKVRQIRTITRTQRIPFPTSYVEIPSMYKGYSEVIRPGVAGERRIEARVIYEDGKPVQVASVKSVLTGTAIPQVERIGTKVLRTPTVGGMRWSVSFIHPLKTGWLSADFYDYPHHNGIDLAAPHGTTVHASAGGVVSLSRWYGEYGYCVIIDHPDGSQTLYAHNSKLLVRPGQTVKQGQDIALVGSTGNSTGNHLHFEIRYKGRFLDPLVYMGK